MIITVAEIQTALNALWPGLQQIWCFDQKYICPTIEEVSQFVTENGIDISDIKKNQVRIKVIIQYLQSVVDLDPAFSPKSMGTCFYCNANLKIGVDHFESCHYLEAKRLLDEFKAENPDCDDFTLQLHAKVKRFANWSFGEAFANKVAGWSKLHSLNICCCRDGVVLIEPRMKTVRVADTNDDNILWVRI